MRAVTSFSDIKAPIAAELKTFQKHFRSAMSSKVALLDKVTGYIAKRRGKQMRPMFVFLTAKLCGDGEVNDSTYNAASLVELLHTATLVHDDVVDESYERRGFFSINALWKNKIAVLVGDYLLSRGLLLALDNGEHRMLQLLSRSVREMSEGELLQIEKARRLDIEESIYYTIIRQKTASLIAAACAAGAASVTDDKEVQQRVHKFGELAGIAFQIRDDLFDYGTQDVGKPLGIDIKEKKMTLPLIHALDKASKSDRRRIIKYIKKYNDDKEKVNEVIRFVHDSGGIEYARRAMYDYREQALEVLMTFPDNAARDSLEQLVVYVTEREK